MSFSNIPPLLQVWSDPKSQRVNRPVTACDVAQVSPTTMWKWIREGKLDVVRYGTQLTRVRTDSLLRLLGASSPK